ncbi:hypothetical protein [Glaciecola sp. KUL10]|uniref:hypothetical protein n=1 Tax=Glaciecola sp. (strain KUL10) TaxID=2161813 RepID=UPI000D78824C|nr:hypothetical protein [Glaciecola sp. KUL10]GBL04471.1 hypothetical protein KUL10_17770 [Glaciecola sp. KUL10]
MKHYILILASVALLLSACGGGEEEVFLPDEPISPTPPSSPDPEEPSPDTDVCFAPQLDIDSIIFSTPNFLDIGARATLTESGDVIFDTMYQGRSGVGVLDSTLTRFGFIADLYDYTVMGDSIAFAITSSGSALGTVSEISVHKIQAQSVLSQNMNYFEVPIVGMLQPSTPSSERDPEYPYGSRFSSFFAIGDKLYAYENDIDWAVSFGEPPAVGHAITRLDYSANDIQFSRISLDGLSENQRVLNIHKEIGDSSGSLLINVETDLNDIDRSYSVYGVSAINGGMYEIYVQGKDGNSFSPSNNVFTRNASQIVFEPGTSGASYERNGVIMPNIGEDSSKILGLSIFTDKGVSAPGLFEVDYYSSGIFLDPDYLDHTPEFITDDPFTSGAVLYVSGDGGGASIVIGNMPFNGDGMDISLIRYMNLTDSENPYNPRLESLGNGRLLSDSFQRISAIAARRMTESPEVYNVAILGDDTIELARFNMLDTECDF